MNLTPRCWLDSSASALFDLVDLSNEPLYAIDTLLSGNSEHRIQKTVKHSQTTDIFHLPDFSSTSTKSGKVSATNSDKFAFFIIWVAVGRRQEAGGGVMGQRLDKICFGGINYLGLHPRYDYRNAKWKEMAKRHKLN